uniref:Uncharacterized protein n=1 Tax=Schistocephalus solidus TaxID=70667 RepID=A0A0X3PRP0_SCHSO
MSKNARLPNASRKLTPKSASTCSKSSCRNTALKGGKRERFRSSAQINQSGSSTRRSFSSQLKMRKPLPICVAPKLSLLSQKNRPASLLCAQQKSKRPKTCSKSRARNSSSRLGKMGQGRSRTKVAQRQSSSLKVHKELPVCVVPRLPIAAGKKRPNSCQSTKARPPKRARRSGSRTGQAKRSVSARRKSIKVGKTHKRAISRFLEKKQRIEKQRNKNKKTGKSRVQGKSKSSRKCGCGSRSNIPKAWKNRLRPRPLKSLMIPCFTYGCQRCKLRSQCAEDRVASACDRSSSNASALGTLAHRICNYIPGCSYLRKRWLNSSASNATVGSLPSTSSRRRRSSRMRRASRVDRSATSSTTTSGSRNEDLIATEGSASLSGSELYGTQLEFSPQFNLLKRPLVHSVGGDEPDNVRTQL